MNVVVTGRGLFVEVQGTAEGAPFDRRELDSLLDLALAGTAELTRPQVAALASRAGAVGAEPRGRARHPQPAQGRRVPAHPRRADARPSCSPTTAPNRSKTGITFAENAFIKARAAAAHTGRIAPRRRLRHLRRRARRGAGHLLGPLGRVGDGRRARTCACCSTSSATSADPHRGAEFHCTIALVVPDTVLPDGTSSSPRDAGAGSLAYEPSGVARIRLRPDLRARRVRDLRRRAGAAGEERAEPPGPRVRTARPRARGAALRLTASRGLRVAITAAPGTRLTLDSWLTITHRSTGANRTRLTIAIGIVAACWWSRWSAHAQRVARAARRRRAHGERPHRPRRRARRDDGRGPAGDRPADLRVPARGGARRARERRDPASSSPCRSPSARVGRLVSVPRARRTRCRACPCSSSRCSGSLANLAAMLVLRGGAKDSINLRGAYLEVLGDLIGSALVIIAAIVIVTTGFDAADPIASIAIAVLIVPRAVLAAARRDARALRVGARRHRRRRDPRAPARHAGRRRGARRARVADHVGLAGVQRPRRGRARGVRIGSHGRAARRARRMPRRPLRRGPLDVPARARRAAPSRSSRSIRDPDAAPTVDGRSGLTVDSARAGHTVSRRAK